MCLIIVEGGGNGRTASGGDGSHHESARLNDRRFANRATGAVDRWARYGGVRQRESEKRCPNRVSAAKLA